MKATLPTMLILGIMMGTLVSSAQDNTIPFKQIERDAQIAQLSQTAAVPPYEAATLNPHVMPSVSSSSAGFVLAHPVTKSSRTLSKGFHLLNGLHPGMAVLDVEMTRHCIANHHCTEGNPLMPSSRAGQLSVNFALVGYSTFLSYKLKKQDSKLWILSPTVGIAVHILEVASGLKNR